MTSSNAAPIGVLLVNLGTPAASEPRAVRRYLAQFLSDPRVVDLPRLLWLPLLYGVVLTTRPARSAKAYARIWRKETGESPLLAITRGQAEELAKRAEEGALGGGRIVVAHAMRYGAPSLRAGLERLCAEGCRRILVMPLYPQYAASTTASAFDEAARVLGEMRLQPALRFLPPYFDDPAYIGAVAQGLREGLVSVGFAPEVVLASFHGLPQLQIDRGDPYQAQCETTVRLLRAAMGLDEKGLRIAFQSRFGRAEWTRPYTDETVVALAREGVKRLVLVAPGFAADCLETLDELGHELREVFLRAGGEEFACIPCLNDSPAGIGLLAALARRELSGWTH